MFRTLVASNGVKGVVPRGAGATAVKHFTSAAAGAGEETSDIKDEQWVAAGVAFGNAEFSDPLTVEELEASRKQIVSGFSTPESGSDVEDAVDADHQMESIQLHTNAVFQRTQQQNIFAAAMNMAADKNVQDACFESLRQNPAVFAAFSSLAAQHGMQIAIDPHHTTRRLALEPAGGAHALDAPAPPGSPFDTLLANVGAALGDAGAAITTFVRRMQRRIGSLLRVLRLRDPDADEVSKDGQEGSADHEHVLFDAVFTSATLIVIGALLARFLGRL